MVVELPLKSLPSRRISLAIAAPAWHGRLGYVGPIGSLFSRRELAKISLWRVVANGEAAADHSLDQLAHARFAQFLAQLEQEHR